MDNLFSDSGDERPPKGASKTEGEQWVKASGGFVPDFSFKGGKEESGQSIYVARGMIEGGLHIGKLRGAFGGVNVGWGGQEMMVPEYEVLTHFHGKWVKASGGDVPANAIVGGHEADGSPLYIGQVKYMGGKHIGKVSLGLGGCNFSWGGKELGAHQYRVLTPKKYWVDAEDGHIPPHSMIVGHEGTGEKMYVGRVFYEGGVHMGKVREAFGGCNFSWGGQELCERKYQVLQKMKGKWVSAKGGEVPDGAYPCGHEAHGDKLYLARTKYKTGVHPGKLHSSFGGVNIAWGGVELGVDQYEVFIPSRRMHDEL